MILDFDVNVFSDKETVIIELASRSSGELESFASLLQSLSDRHTSPVDLATFIPELRIHNVQMFLIPEPPLSRHSSRISLSKQNHNLRIDVYGHPDDWIDDADTVRQLSVGKPGFQYLFGRETDAVVRVA